MHQIHYTLSTPTGLIEIQIRHPENIIVVDNGALLISLCGITWNLQQRNRPFTQNDSFFTQASSNPTLAATITKPF